MPKKMMTTAAESSPQNHHSHLKLSDEEHYTSSSISIDDSNSNHQQVTIIDDQSIKETNLSDELIVEDEKTNKSSMIVKKKRRRYRDMMVRLIRNEAPTSDPRQWPMRKKVFVVLIVALAGFTSPLASSIYYPAIVPMQEYFETTDTIMNATLAIYIYFLAFFPLIWATFGDIFGRRPIYLISFLVAIAGMACSAVSYNVTMFIVFRAISAIGSSSVLSLGAGTIGDIFEAHERGRAFSYYLTGPMLGPAIGPIFGGYLNVGLGWQSIFWFLAILCLCVWLGILFLLPETHFKPLPLPPKTAKDLETVNTVKEEKSHNHQDDEAAIDVLPSINNTINGVEQEKKDNDDYSGETAAQNHQEQHSKQKSKSKNRQCRFINPVAALGLLLNKNIALTVLFLGALFFVYFVLTTNFTRIYTNQYGFDSGTVGLFYLPIAGGSIISGVLGGRISDRVYMSRVAKLPKGTKAYPELRIGGSILYLSILVLLLAFTAFGWCVQKNVHFAYGLVCAFFVGLATGPPNIILSTYLVDCFRERSASVTACNNFTRYILSGTGSLIATDMQRAMGAGGSYTFCGALIFVLAGSFILVRMKGRAWREKANSLKTGMY